MPLLDGREHTVALTRAGDAIGRKRTGCGNSVAGATERDGRELDADTEALANLAG
jgi:hypothetical protein